MPAPNIGAYIETTEIWDVGRLYEIDVTSPEFKDLLVRLYQNVNNIALVLNIKDSGYYSQEEFVNGQLFFPNPNYNSTTGTTPAYRNIFRKVINIGALPNTATINIPHGIAIDARYTFTRIYGAASDTTGLEYIPLPYSSNLLADNIELSADAVNVNITTGSNRTNFNVCYVVLEYIKQ